MKFGYARVSSNTQDYAAQVEALKAAGCERIFSERASGKSTNGRPEFAKLMKALKHGDVVTVGLFTAARAALQAQPFGSAAADEDFRQRSGVSMVAGGARLKA